MAKAPTKSQRERWSRLAEMGCVVCGDSQVQIHHALTGGGGRKNHDIVLPLCFNHHQGFAGIHTLGRKLWEKKFASEAFYLAKLGVDELIG